MNNPEATKDVLTPDKWFKTGDIAIRDEEGFYWIVDRRKELIKYKVGVTGGPRTVKVLHLCTCRDSRFLPRNWKAHS